MSLEAGGGKPCRPNPATTLLVSLVSLVKLQTGEFSWNSHEQGVVLASFYYGHAVTQLVTGCLSLRRLSARCLLLCGSMLTCVITLLTPVMTLFGDVIALVVARVVAGVGQVSRLYCSK